MDRAGERVGRKTVAHGEGARLRVEAAERFLTDVIVHLFLVRYFLQMPSLHPFPLF
ncbi:hypothetical protein TRIP_B330405 [uncultured Desulfatiglans sp.]|uniref:Uncharacterized protein n=1 Tax=Uncultured Desulfatiglans sp. TaxID=1748965 RepID=A0A653A899_UNCDX|nr:hypothetical protein TRIP_B330405 [uncultured Desulfatiglans sp.]